LATTEEIGVNVSVQDRLPLIDLGRRYDAKIIGYYFKPDVSGSRRRNKQRTGKAQVPEQAIFITAHKLEPATYAEGFDTLYYVRIGKDSTREPCMGNRKDLILENRGLLWVS
jgi:predicted kinase